MPLQPIPPHVEALIKQYQQAQIDLINILAQPIKDKTVVAYRKRVLSAVNQELKMLNEYADGWAQEYIPKAYKTGAAQTYETFRQAKLNVEVIALNTGVVNTLVDNCAGLLHDATQFVGRRIQDEIRQASIEAIAQKVSTGSTVKEAQKNLIKRFTDKGITAIRDSRGRELKLDSYAEMVARTTTREATNKGAITTVQDVGRDLVKMSHHRTACPVCAPLEGRIYSISGKDKRYPPLDKAFTGGYANIHPNCRHVLMPYIDELDDDYAQNLAYSNRPFKLDSKEQKQVDAYHAAQKKRIEANRVKREWQQAKLLAPDETPKILSRFKTMKKEGNEQYKNIKQKERAVRAEQRGDKNAAEKVKE